MKDLDAVGLINALAWPLVGLLAIFLFYQPIYKSLVRVSDGKAETVEIGSIKVQFSSESLAQLPRPGDDVASMINKLSDADRETLITIGPDTPHLDSCTPEAFEQAVLAGTEQSNTFFAKRLHRLERYRHHIGSHRRLASAGLVTWAPRALGEGELTCTAEGARAAKLTDLGERTRRYVLDLVSASLTIPTRTEGPETKGK